MVKLGIVSDSHGRAAQLERFAALCRQERYDAVIHLGDVRSDARWLERNLNLRVISVAGNCDPFSGHAREERLSFDECRLLAVHGDAYGVKYGYERLSYHAEEIGAGIALFGHTHRPFAGYVGRVMLVNPGALMDGNYAELRIEGHRAIPMERNLNELHID